MDLKHTILYAKHYYFKSDNLIEDLTKCLNKDGYLPSTAYDVAELLWSRLLDYYIPCDNAKVLITKFIMSLTPEGCWKIGYYTKGHKLWFLEDEDDLQEYDYHTAVIYACLHEFKHMTYAVFGDLPDPDPEVLPLNIDANSLNS